MVHYFYKGGFQHVTIPYLEVSSKVVFLSTYIALEYRLLVGFGSGGWKMKGPMCHLVVKWSVSMSKTIHNVIWRLKINGVLLNVICLDKKWGWTKTEYASGPISELLTKIIIIIFLSWIIFQNGFTNFVHVRFRPSSN